MVQPCSGDKATRVPVRGRVHTPTLGSPLSEGRRSLHSGPHLPRFVLHRPVLLQGLLSAAHEGGRGRRLAGGPLTLPVPPILPRPPASASPEASLHVWEFRWREGGRRSSRDDLQNQLTETIQTQPGRLSVVCLKKYSLVTASLLSLNLAVTIHFKRSLFFLLKLNRLRAIFRLTALGRGIAKPFWSIILNISSCPQPPSTEEAGMGVVKCERTRSIC